MKRIAVLVFILMALAQWMVPGQMLWKHHNVIKKGLAFKFKTAPVDPVDYFKGRYVALAFEANSFPVDSNFTLERGEEVFIKLGTNAAGYAYISGVATGAPSNSNDYVQAAVSYIGYDDSTRKNILHINYPFQEYYLEESRAPALEQKYRDARKFNGDTYAVVNIYKGEGVIKNLYINEKLVE